jgi:hypothetical protein
MDNSCASIYTKASLRSLCDAVHNVVIDASITIDCFH